MRSKAAIGVFLAWLAALPVAAQSIPDATLRAMFARPTEVPFPAGNAYTAEREILGRTLFFDPRLSGSNLLACASCHNPSFGWGDGQPLGRGQAMVQLRRRSPTILNAAWGTSFFWDGRAKTLEEQAHSPISQPTEMDMPLGLLAEKMFQIKGYRKLFDAAYPGEAISVETITRSLATFERSVVSGRSAFDRWVEGEPFALSPSERHGLDVFVGRGHCSACHTGWNFTDRAFHDTGVESGDMGRAEFDPANPLARYAFKTPSLADVGRRSPYMHDGSVRTLEAVVKFYVAGGTSRPSKSPVLQPLHLSELDQSDLVAFLTALTAPPQEFAAPALPR